eukprot:2334398-Pleurochrysis_carterae.AAC.1
MRLHDNGMAVQLGIGDAKHNAKIVEMESKDNDVQCARHLCVVLRLRLEPHAVVDVLGEVLYAHKSAAGKVRGLQQLTVVVLPLSQIV